MKHQAKYESIVLMGQAGTGKGTQAKKIAEYFDCIVFSTGDKSREIAALDTPLGKVISEIHTKGWIPEWLASYLMTKVLMEVKENKSIVFESVARKPEEAKKLHAIHEDIGRSYIVILLEADELILKKRLLGRNRTGYDVEDKIKKRRQAFDAETTQSLNFFRESSKLVTIDASREVELVFEDLVKIVSV